MLRQQHLASRVIHHVNLHAMPRHHTTAVLAGRDAADLAGGQVRFAGVRRG